MLIHRLALYYVPAADDPLTRAGNAWLGRDPVGGAPPPRPATPGLDLPALTAAPARYGFHATLKPPFRPRAPADDVLPAALTAIERLAARHRRTALPPLRLDDLDGALALTLAAPCPALHALCDDAVASLDHLRAPAPPEEHARRRAAGLDPAQEAMLQRWGYPYVMGCWRFHITLTGRLNEAHAAAARRHAAAHFGPHLATARPLDAIALFIEPTQGAPLVLHSRHLLAE